MATQELRKRSNWQTLSGKKALDAEKLFQVSLQNALNEVYPKTFLVERHPKEFGDIYSNYEFPKDITDKIYNIYIW